VVLGIPLEVGFCSQEPAVVEISPVEVERPLVPAMEVISPALVGEVNSRVVVVRPLVPVEEVI
jgi:hypothetical protein